jgi:predicted hotdog family 3-hydroxylacyl-ACP dehydratase
MTVSSYQIDALLPHARPMILLDGVVERLADGIVTELLVRPGLPFFQLGRGIPAHVALEWMAQTCGAHVGATAMESGQPVRVGFLLGTRDFASDIDWFTPGQHLRITARLVFHEAETGSFDCQVELAGEVVARAKLTVYQPSDMAAMLASQRIGSGS